MVLRPIADIRSSKLFLSRPYPCLTRRGDESCSKHYDSQTSTVNMPDAFPSDRQEALNTVKIIGLQMKIKKKLANFRLDAQDYDHLYNIAEYFGVNRTTALRLIIRRFVRKDLKSDF